MGVVGLWVLEGEVVRVFEEGRARVAKRRGGRCGGKR